MKTNVAILVRVSTQIQDYSRQIDDLTKIAGQRDWNVVEVITEKISGATSNDQRDGIKQLLDGAKSKKFSKVLISEISRLGRSTIHTLNVLDQLNTMQVSVFVQDMNIETLDEDGKVNFQAEMLLHMLSLFAKRERETLISRIHSGLEYARKCGKTLGRPSGTSESEPEFLKKHKSVIETLKLGLSIRKTAKLHEVSTTTVQKVKRIFHNQLVSLNNTDQIFNKYEL